MGKLKKAIWKKVSYCVNTLSQSSMAEIWDGLTTTPEFQRLCRQTAAESFVLLKNDGVFPVGQEQIALFGRCQINPFYVGYGSGGDIRPPYRVSIADGLKRNGMTLDEKLLAIYKEWTIKNPPEDGFWGPWPMNYEEMPVAENLVKETAERCKKAVVVIGRAAGEDRESKAGKGSWYLTDEEKSLLVLLRKYFTKVGVLLNCGSIMDTSFVEELDIDAAMYIWQGGQEMGNAVYDVLSGAISPSGHLTDTIAAISDYPSSPYFGKKVANTYVEDIYVGYRYFESFANEKVLYPFGFGLSYTTFDICLDRIDCQAQEITFTVKNTGMQSGKEVVQLYVETPQATLGKAKRVLIDFVKTKTLEVGECQTFVRKIDWNVFASYDDMGRSGYVHAWVLEAGNYEFYLGNNVRDAVSIWKYEQPHNICIKQCEEACAPEYSFERMVNKDNRLEYEKVPVRTIDRATRILENLPKEIPQTKDMGYTLQMVKEGQVSMDDFIAQLSVREMEALARGSLEGMGSFLGADGNAGVFGGIEKSLCEKGVPCICTNDGPSGVRLRAHTTLIPNGVAVASTFNEELVYSIAAELGKEVIDRGSQVLLAPGMNIHRHPLCGRNFEYFSEDPLLTGKIAAAYVKGVQHSGASATVKHFACNNQEVNRKKNDSRLSERALREIYLKGFEICLKESKPDCLMTSYNKLNGEWTYYNYDLATQILRKEWEYEGCVMTDWWIVHSKCGYFKDVRDHAYRIRAHVNVFMPGVDNFGKYKGKVDGSVAESVTSDAGITIGELQQNAKRVLEFCLKKI